MEAWMTVADDSLPSGIFSFGRDMVGEGTEVVLDAIQERAGMSGVILAASYHDARDVMPHNPLGVVYYHDPGTVCFLPDPRKYASPALVPDVDKGLEGRDILGEVSLAAREREMRCHAWLQNLHADRPDQVAFTTRNAFGDPSYTDLCPANPAGRATVLATAADLAARDIDSIVAEGWHFQPFAHGWQHERSFIALDELTQFLLSLCFCDHCRAAGEAADVDVERLARVVRAQVRAFLDADADVPMQLADPARVRDLADGSMADYLAAREETVTSLVHGVAEAVHSAGSSTQLVLIDPGGAMKGYGTGRPEGGLAVDVGWTIGVNLTSIAPLVDGLLTLSYSADAQRLTEEFAGYLDRVGGRTRIGTVLRPAVPDCSSPADLRAKASLLGQLGADSISYYHYGLMRRSSLDWIRHAHTPST
jgi:hypothetical protein